MDIMPSAYTADICNTDVNKLLKLGSDSSNKSGICLFIIDSKNLDPETLDIELMSIDIKTTIKETL